LFSTTGGIKGGTTIEWDNLEGVILKAYFEDWGGT